MTVQILVQQFGSFWH